jgi:hypothetical protein
MEMVAKEASPPRAFRLEILSDGFTIDFHYVAS